MKLRAIVAAMAATLVSGCTSTRQSADLLIHGGPVLSASSDDQVYRAVAITDGKIVAVGGEDLARRFTAKQVIDLHGRLAMPGFNDAHSHLRGRAKRFVELSDVRSIAELQARIRTRIAELPPGEWITGYGWSEDRLAEGRKPTRLDLDAAAPDNPVYLDREGGHSEVVNSRALALAGLTASNADPEGGHLERMDDGSLSGVIRETRTVLTHLIPDATPEELRADLGERLRDLFRLGITSVTDASTPIADYHAIWQPLYSAKPAPLPRATLQINPDVVGLGPDGAMAALRSLGQVTGGGDDFLRIGAVKVFVDGGFTGPAAWTTQGYRSDPDFHGAAAVDLDALERFSTDAHAAGWQLGYHAIGDLAIEKTVQMFDRILKAHPRADHRHHLNHFSVMPDNATMATMAADGIGIVQQPNFTYSLEGRYRAYLPDAALAHNNAIATPLNHGIKMAFSSDIIPIGPLVGIYAALTRKGASGTVYGPEEAIAIRQALRLYTAGGAAMNFRENTLGQIAPGMLADLIILDRDLLSAAPEDILRAQVDLTILAGRIVFDRRTDAPATAAARP